MPPIWVIYDHPKDFPDHYVARCWDGLNDDTNEEAQHGLYIIHDLIQDSLEYEIQRLSKRKT